MSTVTEDRTGCPETPEREKRLLLLLDYLLKEYDAAIKLAECQRELDLVKLVVWALQQPKPPGYDLAIALDKRDRIEEKFRRKLQRLKRRWMDQSFTACEAYNERDSQD